MATELERIAGISAQIGVLDDQIEQTRAERSMLEHIDDDAQRDALVSGHYDDRADAKRTDADVTRMDRQLARMERSRSRLVTKRDTLIRNLAAS